MGYYGNIDLKLTAQKMGKNGKSYQKIIDTLHIPKTTVSDWCKNISLSKQQLLHLYESKKKGALKGSIIAANKKKQIRNQQTRELLLSGKQQVGTLTKRERFIAGISFYASEGTKSDKGCCFANSDPFIIQFMVKWFKEFGNVDPSKYRGAIWLHEGLNELEAKKYWSNITGIPKENFYKTYIAKNKTDSKKIRKNIHSYGVFSLYVHNTVMIRKMKGFIDGILQKP